MGFEELLGNDRLKSNLRQTLRRDRISHFYLISGPEGSGKHTLARLLSAAILCDGENRPCGACPACRKALAGIHPDVIVVDDPEKKTVPVELIRQARADLFIRPNEGSHKIYLFPRAQDMQGPSQNALLKVLEEPPSYGVFLLLADNPGVLLPTVRSRCTELTLEPLPESVLLPALKKEFPEADEGALRAAGEQSGGYLGQAKALMGAEIPPQTIQIVKAYALRSSLDLVRVLVPMEKWKRDQLLPILCQCLEMMEGALAFRSGMSGSPYARAIGLRRSPQELFRGVECLKKAIQYTQSNVSPAAVCGYLEWALR